MFKNSPSYGYMVLTAIMCLVFSFSGGIAAQRVYPDLVPHQPGLDLILEVQTTGKSIILRNVAGDSLATFGYNGNINLGAAATDIVTFTGCPNVPAASSPPITASTPTGSLYTDTDDGKLYHWTGSAWAAQT